VDHKIVNIKPIFLRYKFPPNTGYEYSAGTVDYMDAALIQVTDDVGETGLGEVTHGQFCYEPIIGLVQHFNRLLVGRPALEINRAWQLMYGSTVFWNRQGIGIGVMGGIDIALHDLAGKILHLPVYQLLGGLVRSKIRAYASNGLFRNPEPLIADVKRAKRLGFNAYKMRVVTPDTIIPQVKAFRDEFGESMDLMVDAVQGSMAIPWALAVSKRIAKQLEPFNVLWFEEPCPTEDISGYADIRSSTSLSIAGAESVPTAHAFKPYLDQGAFDILQFDIATSGFTEGSRIASLAAAYRKPVAIHSWGTIVSALAGINMALTLPNCAITEYCFMDHPFNDLLSLNHIKPEHGYIHPTANEGLGVRFDEDLVDKFKYEPIPLNFISTEERDILL